MTIDDEKKYGLLSTIVLHESKAMWDTSNLFLLANTILATFIGSNLNGSHHNNKIIVFMLPLLGLIISILWFFSYKRTSRYYKFRMAQIRELEKKMNHPCGFDIFAGRPQCLADGNKVCVDNEFYSARVLGMNFRSFIILDIIIYLFIIFFLIFTIFLLPWEIHIYNK